MTMEKMGRVVALCVVIFVAASLGGWFLGKAAGRKEVMIEAVKNNHGHHRIVDELGSTSFEWGPAPAGSSPIVPKKD